MAKSEYRGKIVRTIDDTEDAVNEALDELKEISEDKSLEEILEHVDNAKAVLTDLADKLY